MLHRVSYNFPVKRLALTLSLMAGISFGETLPTGMSEADVAQATRFLAMSGTTRLLRSAEAYASWPGIKMGVEITVVPSGRLSTLGNANGSVGGILPIPRVYFTKGWMEEFEFTLSFFPPTLNTLTSVGGILKWAFLKESQRWMSVAGIAGITSVRAFQTEFEGINMEVGAVASKDYVRIKPYGGASLMLAQGKVTPAVALGASETGALLGLHLFLGVEFDLPFNLTVQIDRINADLSGTFFVGKKF